MPKGYVEDGLTILIPSINVGFEKAKLAGKGWARTRSNLLDNIRQAYENVLDEIEVDLRGK